MEEMSPEIIFGTYTCWKYDESTWFINALNGSLYMYLLEGETYALLIDTAYGFGQLREYVEKLTSKPILVVNTHGHLDHVGGNGEWEKVYMHPNAIIDHETLKGGPCDISKLPYPNYEKVFIEDGYEFDLGGRNVEVIDITAHSNGSLALLDSSHRLVFVGDEIEAGQVLLYELSPNGEYNLEQRLNAHKGNMEKLISRKDEFDFLCPNHNGSPISKDHLDDYKQLCENILNGEVIIEDKINHFYIEKMPVGSLLCRTRYGKASFFIKKTELNALISAKANV